MVAVGVGVFVFVFAFALLAHAARTAPPVSRTYLADAVEKAGGRNVVNVILVDFRALDTLGEVTVLVAAALGLAALVRARRGQREQAHQPGGGGSGVSRRSLILETVTQAAFDTIWVVSLYLLFAGHNQPGGGFIGGLVEARRWCCAISASAAGRHRRRRRPFRDAARDRAAPGGRHRRCRLAVRLSVP